ncbi:hypothetical protein DFH07DRAFT_963131 [Mycena maculata]|uniref:Uncharacterized protein n=1 Tax=Mycena maculata TaxID=230809 RepID=A0AAD7IPE9_9AGAR|nr:hypothetical protein DFH07DRAFT_963131 [Mycena maculata]
MSRTLSAERSGQTRCPGPAPGRGISQRPRLLPSRHLATATNVLGGPTNHRLLGSQSSHISIGSKSHFGSNGGAHGLGASSASNTLRSALSRRLPPQESERLAYLDRLKFFLAAAGLLHKPAAKTPTANPALNRFLLPSQEYVSCVLYHLTGTDGLRAAGFLFASGRFEPLSTPQAMHRMPFRSVPHALFPLTRHGFPAPPRPPLPFSLPTPSPLATAY